MGYQAGDTVVHPRHGVAKVTGTQTRGKDAYLELFFEPKSMTIMVPVDSLDEVGIRGVVTKDEAEAILEILEEETDVPTAWVERNAATLSRIQSTELAQASMVIRDLTRHADRANKPLSAAENASLTTCLDTVSSELALAFDISQDEARALILSKIGEIEVEAADS